MTLLSLLAQNKPLLFILGFLVIALAFKELLLFQLRKSAFFYYLALFPGVVLHEISHTIFCLIFFAKIKKVQFFSRDGGMVIHEKSKLPILGDFFISIAPLLVGATLFYFLARDFMNLSSLGKIAVSYLEITIFITMLPSLQDFKNAATMYLSLVIVITIAVSNKMIVFTISHSQLQIMTFCLILLVVVNLLVAIPSLFYAHKD